MRDTFKLKTKRDARLFRQASRLRLWFGRMMGLGTLVFGVWWIIEWANTDPPDAPITSGDAPTIRMENLRSFVARKNGKKLWQLAAREILVAPDKSYTDARGVSRGVFFRDDHPFLHLSAQKVRLWNQTNDLEATGTVSVTGPQKFFFRTQSARWNNAQKRIVCPKPVRASLRGLDFQTPTLFYNWDAGDFYCPKPAQVSGEGLSLKAGTVKASTKTRIVTLGGGAELVFDPKTVKGLPIP